MIVGAMRRLGSWQNLVPMTRVKRTDPIQKEKTMFWEKQLDIKYDQNYLDYRFAIKNKKNNSQVWEREPDRHCNLANLLGYYKQSNIEDDINRKDCIYFRRKHNKLIKVDVNFVSKFYIDQITDSISIGLSSFFFGLLS